MKTLSAIYKGNRIVELVEDIDLPKDTKLFVFIPDDDEIIMPNQLQLASESVFEKLWDNEQDEVWNEYIQTT